MSNPVAMRMPACGWARRLAGWWRRRQSGEHLAARRLARVKAAMLEALDSLPEGTPSLLRNRVACAQDAMRLWHLRSDMMQAVASAYGEARARDVLARITRRFRGLVPQGMLR